MIQKYLFILSSFVLLVVSSAISFADDPQLSLYQSGSSISSSTFTIAQLPATISLDVHLNTASHSVDGLEFYLGLSTAGNSTPTYAGGGTISSSQNPFSNDDNGSTIASGDPLDSSSDTFLFASSGDYDANADYNVITYSINTANLTAGTYVIRAFGEFLTDTPNDFSTDTFATPQDFTLTIVAPEPSTACSFFAVAMLLARPSTARRRSKKGR